MISNMSAPQAKTKVTVGATSTTILALNRDRTHAWIQWDDTNTEKLYIGLGVPAVQDKGIYIAPGGHYEIGPHNMHTGAIYGICTSGAQTARITEA
jgi:hypothetical protein